MDTAKLELAAQRYRELHDALDEAREDLIREAVEALRQDDERGNQATDYAPSRSTAVSTPKSPVP